MAFDLAQIWAVDEEAERPDPIHRIMSLVPAQRQAEKIDRRRRAEPRPQPKPEQLEEQLAAKESKRCKTLRVSAKPPYFPEIDVPLSLISENKWSIIGAVAGYMKRAHAPKEMLRMFRDHSEKAPGYDELMSIVRRWIKTS